MPGILNPLLSTYATAGGATPTLSYRASYLDSATAAATFTFSSCDIGTAGSNRHVVVITGTRASGGANALLSMTINGVPATILAQGINGTTCMSAIAIAQVSSGTTGVTIAPTWNNTGATSCFISVYACYDLSSATAVATATSSSQTANLNVNTSAGGIVIAGGYINGNVRATPTGLTEDADANNGVRGYYAGSASNVSAATPMTITIAWASTSGEHTSCVSLR